MKETILKSIATLLTITGLLTLGSAVVRAGSTNQPAELREGEGRVLGTVFDAGARVEGATVTLTRADMTQFQMVKTTDSRGQFSLLILDASKQYKIRIEKTGYLPLEQDLKPVVGDTIRVDFELKPFTLNDELATSEVEPRAKVFQINLRFSKAKYTEEEDAPIKIRKYGWGYPEISLSLEMMDVPTGTFTPGSSAAVIKAVEDDIISQGAVKISEREVKAGLVAGKEMKFKSGGRSLFVRVFFRGDTRYMLVAQARDGEKDALLQRILDSFQFLKNV